MTEEEINKITAALQSKGATKPCARCGHPYFQIEGVGQVRMYTGIDRAVSGPFTFGGPFIPSAIVACAQCGAITEYALAALGFPLTSGTQ